MDNISRARPASAGLLREISLFPFRHVEYVVFCLLLMIKLYFFAKYLGFVFVIDDMIAVSLGSILLISCWALLLPRFAGIMALWLLDCLLSFLIVSDVVYYRYFTDFITIPVLLQAGQVGALGGSIVNLLAWKDLVFVVDCLLFAPFLFFRKEINASMAPYLQRAALFVLSAVVGYALVFVPIHAYTSKYGNNLFVNNWWNLSVYNVTGLLGFHAYDVKRYADENLLAKTKATAADKAAVRQWFSEHQRQLAAATPLFGAAKGKNVMIVQLESFQNYMVGKTVNGKEITPNMNKLKAEMMYFDHFYTQVGQGRTSDAEFLVNTSLYPLPSGSVYVRYPHHLYDNLPAILKQNGYGAYVFHPFEKSFWNRQAMYQNYGIDKFYGKEDFKPAEIIGWDIGDEYLFAQAIDDLQKSNQPFYSFIIALSSHHPYSNVPQKYHALDLGQYEGTLFGNYLTATHYVDYAIGTLVEKLKKDGLWDNTVLLFYGDHDSGIKMDPQMAEFVGVSADELTQEQITRQVPLFAHIPGNDKTGEFHQTVGMIDIAPTVLHLLGIDASQYFLMGRTITDEQNHQVNLRYGSFTDGEVYFKASADGDFNKGVCYDLATRQPTDRAACKNGVKARGKELSLSDKLIYNDLLRDFRKEDN